MANLTPASQAMLDRHAVVRDQLLGADLPWLAELRDEALAAFRTIGLPTPRVEAWKYTNLNALDSLDLASIAGDAKTVSVDDLPSPIGDGPRLVFVDGRYRDELSRNDAASGVRVLSLASAMAQDKDILAPRLGDLGDRSPLLTLNGAFLEDGFVVVVDPGTSVAAAIEILHWDTAGDAVTVRQPRNVIAAADNARVTVIETHAGAGASAQFFNGATMVTVAPGAAVQHFRIQDQGAGSVHVNTVRARVEKDAQYQSFVLSTGAGIARDEVQVDLAAPGADTQVDGVYLATDKQHLDNTTVMRHAQPNTTSRETYKGALDGHARAVFQGNIRVETGADGSDGRLSNKTLLLSDTAEIDSKPQLEIYADDVKCAHGATAGELDDTALFYLRTRGINEAQARRMLIEAFLNEAIEQADAGEALNAVLLGRVQAWLANTNIAPNGATA